MWWFLPVSALALLVEPHTSEISRAESAASPGDLDGDGDAEVAALVRESDGTYSLELYNGGSAPGSTAPLSRFKTGATGSGLSLRSAGDVNGDGRGDLLLVSCRTATSFEAIAWVYLGQTSGLEAAPLVLGGVGSGCAVAADGDLDGDGYGDIVIGNPGSESSDGVVMVYFGGSAGVSVEPNLTMYGRRSEGLGVAVATGDFDRDGYGELAATNRGGEVQVFGGTSAGPSTRTVTRLEKPRSGRVLGSVLVTPGDMTGDGYPDLVASLDTKLFQVHQGSATGVAKSASATLELPGVAVKGWPAAGGDLNGDGYADLVVAGPMAGREYGLFVFHGRAPPLNVDPIQEIRDTSSRIWAVGLGDVDGDGYGDAVWGGTGSVGARYYLGYRDDDLDGTAFPDDCDDQDAAVGAPISQFVDADGDGWGSVTPASACPETPGFSLLDTDCDDRLPQVHPDAPEVCDPDATDEDCDGLADDQDPKVDPSSWSDWFRDLDGDGLGDREVMVQRCVPPDRHVSDGTDCDDLNPTIGGPVPLFWDRDGDGFGLEGAGEGCPGEAGLAERDGDCADDNPQQNPSLDEVCDGVDNNCDGQTDAPLPCDDPGPPPEGVAGCACDAPAGAGWISALIPAFALLRRRRS